MKKVLLAACLAVGCLTACDKDDDNDVNSTDQTFVMKASLSNTAEVMAGQLAASRGSSAAVRSFGQMMVDEHTMAQANLRTAGTAVGMSVRDTVDPDHQALMMRLNGLSGRSFDTAYMNSQVRDHTVTLANFQNEINNGNHPTIRNYATQNAPHIQMHLQKADSISRTL